MNAPRALNAPMAKFTTRPSPNTSVSATATAASSEPYSQASTRLTTSKLAVTDPNGFIESLAAVSRLARPPEARPPGAQQPGAQPPETWHPYELAVPTTWLGGNTN